MLEKKKLTETAGGINHSNSGKSSKSPMPANDVKVNNMSLNSNNSSSFKLSNTGKPIGAANSLVSNSNSSANNNNKCSLNSMKISKVLNNNSINESNFFL